MVFAEHKDEITFTDNNVYIFWDDFGHVMLLRYQPGKMRLVTRQLRLMTKWCHISELELWSYQL